MSLRDPSASLAQLRELVARGPVPMDAHSVPARARRRLRSALLRALRPYSYYQYEINSLVLSLLGEKARENRRVWRLEVMAEDLVVAVESLRRRTDPVETLGSELHAVPYIADSPFEQFESPVGEVTGYRSMESVASAASAYAVFEDLFRGPPERVTELQRPYLSLVAEHQPVLDVGCGRGEFLALLASEGITAHGVDNDDGMIARCQSRGLSVVHADATEYLERLEDRTLGTVFCAQVIEHLPVDELRRLLEVSRRKLKPGGLFIAETVNPHSIPALKTFWVDVTHQHPIFPEVALALCAIAGFCPSFVFAPGYQHFAQAMFESTSYAVVATAPADSTNGSRPESAPEV